jgi:hypothetical protein
VLKGTDLQSHLSNPWNHAVAYLEMFAGDNRLATGSSFFWRNDGRTFLVTNWHNLAGRNPLTHELMSSSGAVPDRIAFGVYKRVTEPDKQGFFEMAYTAASTPLNDSAGPLWLQHPEYGESVDVAAIDVSEAAKGYEVSHCNEIESDATASPVVSQDAFVVGFPFGLIASAPAPVWKRGTIALDPSFDADGLPKMLIDTATREGMSGSVVVARYITVGRTYRKRDGIESDPVLYATHDLVAGIYSGRHYPHLEKAQLGIVWKRRAIDGVVVRGRRASS